MFDCCKKHEVYQASTNKSVVSRKLHPILPLESFEKWSIDLMGPLSLIKREFKFIVITTDYQTKFVIVQAFKTSVKAKVVRFIYKLIITSFD